MPKRLVDSANGAYHLLVAGRIVKKNIIMKTHLTEEEILDLAFTKLNIANPNVDKIVEMAEAMDLEFDEENNAYKNKNLCH